MLREAFSEEGGEVDVVDGGRACIWKDVICEIGIIRYEPEGACRLAGVIEVFWTGEMFRTRREVVGSAT